MIDVNSLALRITGILDASPKTVPAKLEADEAIINPHFMRQLLEYGIKLGRDDAHLQSLKAEPAGLDGEIAVSFKSC